MTELGSDRAENMREEGKEMEMRFLMGLREAAIKKESTLVLLDSVFMDATYEELAKKRNDADIGDAMPLWHRDVNRFDKEECKWLEGPSREKDVYFFPHGDPRFSVKEKSKYRKAVGWEGEGGRTTHFPLQQLQQQTSVASAPVTAIKRGNTTVRVEFQSPSRVPSQAVPSPPSDYTWSVEKTVHMSFPHLNKSQYICAPYGGSSLHSHRHRRYNVSHHHHSHEHRSVWAIPLSQEPKFSGGVFPLRVFDSSFVRETAAYALAPDCVARTVAETRSDGTTVVRYYGRGMTCVDAIRAAKSEGIRSLERLTVSLMSAVWRLHSHGIAHCNLRPQNVVVSRVDEAEGLWESVLVGLSNASFAPALERRSMFGLGAPGYTPPDVLANGSRDRSTFEDCMSADCWALGCMVFAMFSVEWKGRDDLPWTEVDVEMNDRRLAAQRMVEKLDTSVNRDRELEDPKWKLMDETPLWVLRTIREDLNHPFSSGRSLSRAIDAIPEDLVPTRTNTPLPSTALTLRSFVWPTWVSVMSDPLAAQYAAVVDEFANFEHGFAGELALGEGLESTPLRRVDVALVRDAAWWSILVGLSRTGEERKANLPLASDMYSSLCVLLIGGIAATSLVSMRTDAVMADVISAMVGRFHPLEDVMSKTVSTGTSDFVSRCTIEYLKFCGSDGAVGSHPLGIIVHSLSKSGPFQTDSEEFAASIDLVGSCLRNLYCHIGETRQPASGREAGEIASYAMYCVDISCDRMAFNCTKDVLRELLGSFTTLPKKLPHEIEDALEEWIIANGFKIPETYL